MLSKDKALSTQRVIRFAASVLIIFLTAAAAISLFTVNKIQPIATSPEPTPTRAAQTTSTETKCKIMGGVWRELFNECENIKEDQCSELGGSYNNCESACRHDPTAEVCIEICVSVCKL